MRCPCKAAVALWQETRPNEAYVKCPAHGTVSWDYEAGMAFQGGEERTSGYLPASALFAPVRLWPHGGPVDQAYSAFYAEYFPEYGNG